MRVDLEVQSMERLRMLKVTPMTAAQELLVKLGCCSSSAWNGLPRSAVDGDLSMISSAVLTALLNVRTPA